MTLQDARLLARALSWTGPVPGLFRDHPGEGTAHIFDRKDWDQLIVGGLAVETTDPNRPITRQTGVTFAVTPKGRKALLAYMQAGANDHPSDWHRRFWGTP